MCSLAPRAAAAGLGTTAFLDRQRGVVAAAMAPASSAHKTREPVRRARAASDEVSATAPAARKRGRHDDDALEHVVVDPAASSALRIRMDAELVALRGLLKRARLLPRSGGSAPLAAEKKYNAPPAKKLQHPVAVQRAVAKNPIAPEVRNSMQPPAAAKQNHPVQRAAAAKPPAEALKKRRPEKEEAKELARAAAREEFRRMLLEMEKAALPDETIYPEELEALGIPFEFLVTRTWKQAWLEDRRHAKKVQEVVAVWIGPTDTDLM